MKFKEWKAGDEAFALGCGWVILGEGDTQKYPLEYNGFSITEDGKRYEHDSYPALLDHNPFDKSDPKNPPAHGMEWPFVLNGRPVKIGDELVSTLKGRNTLGKVHRLILEFDCVAMDMDAVHFRHRINPEYFCWPDELPAKKKVAKWAYPIIGIPGTITIGFTEEMTEEEARKAYGSGVQLIPGTEREVEG